MRDDSQDNNPDDSEEQLRNRLLQQQPGAPPPATEDPVYAPPDTPPPPPDMGPAPGPYNPPDPPPYVTPDQPAPAPAPAPWQAEAPAPAAQTPGQDPNSPAALAAINAIYGPGGSVYSPPSPTATWNPTTEAYNPSAPGNTPTPTGPPSGGSLSNPSFASQLVAWAATQPGVNPSVKNDPNYWISRFTSGAFGNDINYAITRMMQAEGAPESGAPAPTITTGQNGLPKAASPATAPQSYAFQTVAGQPAPQGAWNSDFVNQIRALLMARLQANSQPVDPNDPTIAGPLTAARDEATRSSDKERTALAENLYANGGLNTDAISQKIQQSGESNAQGLSTLRAQLMTRELQSRKDELTQLMQMALASGDAQSAQAIQMQIAELSAEVNREGMDLDAGKYSAYLNQNAALAGLNG